MKYLTLWNKYINAFMELFIRRIFRFKGRTNRKIYTLFTIIIFTCGTLYSSLEEYIGEYFYLSMVIDIIFILFFLQYLTVTSRRFHDLNVSGWWSIIILLIPLSAIGLCFFKGTNGPNKYGEPPKY